MDLPAYRPRSVLGAVGVALIVGLTIVLTAVLPAEYGVDPTGVGARLGLVQLAVAPPVETTTSPATVQGEADAGNHSLTLEAGEGVEYKLLMLKGQVLDYRWIAQDTLHVDLHGEPKGDATGYYESYVVSNAREMQGKFTALFDGTHGWYWRNDGDEPVFIDLRFTGEYQGIKDMTAP